MLTHPILAAVDQAWPAFVLVAGLLLIGSVAGEDGLFEATGARLAGSRLGPRALLVALLALVAGVTAVLNLDTAVVFLTPVLLHAARHRGVDERPFLYGSVFMANSASLLLPGSNLTNLLVLRGHPQDGASFAAHMLPAWLAACAITTAFVAVALRPRESELRAVPEPPPLRFGLGAAATLAAALLVVLLPDPALPVLAVGVAVAALRRLRPRLDGRLLAFLFAVTVILGTLARVWHGPARMLAAGGVWTAAATGALASLVLNNLPATVLLSARAPAHPDALLLGLDLGPNLAVTGSLAAVLWLQAARGVGARPSIATYTRLGVVLVPLTLAAAVGVLGVPLGGSVSPQPARHSENPAALPITPLMSEATFTDSYQELAALEAEEHRVSLERRRLHLQIDNGFGAELARERERELSLRRRELHLRIDALRGSLGLPTGPQRRVAQEGLLEMPSRDFRSGS